MDTLVVANPTAGGGRPTPGEVLACCRAAGADGRAWITAGPGEAIALVARASAGPAAPRVIVAVGGDGTVREVAEGLARGLGRWPGGAGATPVSALGHGAGVAQVSLLADDAGPTPVSALVAVPAGSGNSAYQAVWGEQGWQEAVAAAFDSAAHRVRLLDLVRLVELDRAAVLGVNTGLVAAIASSIERDKNERRGDPPGSAGGAREDPQGGAGAADEERYWNAMARALAEFQPARLRVAIDGRVLHEGGAMLVTVGGVRRFGRGAFALLPRSILDDALLDVCVTAEVTSERLAELAALVPAGTHLAEAEVVYERGRSVRIERLDGEGLEIEHDGDPLEVAGTLTLEVLPAAVPVLAPIESRAIEGESLWSS
jgi:diacylglycerol kinase (ATP)